jgi:predicted unusual protein kinase regulating ubiquinone biosynthesis (AarF/ABC1/UbiB family)
VAGDDMKIPKGRVRRSAKLGTAMSGQAAKYAGTKAAGVARSKEGADEKLEARHLETALKMVRTLGEMKGAAMKIGQLASFIDTEFLPPEYAEIYQEELAKLRTSAPPMPWEKVEKVISEEYGEPVHDHFSEFDPHAFAAASIGQVHRATLNDGRDVAVKIQYPGVAEALESDLRNAGVLVRLAKVLAPGLDAKSVAEELKLRVLEELDYEYEAQNQRTFSRAYRGHPFIYVPDVITRLSRRRVLVTEYVDNAMGFEEVKQLEQPERDRFGEIVFRFCFGSIYHLQHFNADSHPGNYLLMPDGRVAFLDFGMTKKLDREQIELEQAALDAAIRKDPDMLRERLHELGFIRKPTKLDAERLMDHVMLVGGWYIEDREYQVSARRVMKIIESASDPRSEYFQIMRRENIPADELMGRRMEIGVIAVLAQLGAKRNWHRIMREWVYADEPETELGREEWDYFESRGVKRVPGIAAPS